MKKIFAFAIPLWHKQSCVSFLGLCTERSLSNDFQLTCTDDAQNHWTKLNTL